MATDYITVRKSRNRLSSLLHTLLNIFFGVSTILVGLVSGSWIIGFVLVIVSKWRMFAVRPRYLWLNLKSNLVDLIVGFSFVLLAYFSGSTFLPVHAFLAVLYTLWLTLIKPRTSETWNLFQALVAVFVGTSAATILCATSNPALLCLLEFLIGYAAARHVLAQNTSGLHDGFPALIFGVLFSEITLFVHSWLIVYAFPSFGLMIPQLALLLALFAFLSGKLYTSVENHDGHLKFPDIAFPLVFSFALLLVLILVFSKPMFNV